MLKYNKNNFFPALSEGDINAAIIAFEKHGKMQDALNDFLFRIQNNKTKFALRLKTQNEYFGFEENMKLCSCTGYNVVHEFGANLCLEPKEEYRKINLDMRYELAKTK